jgi:type IV pilus assembly protein PilY1
MSRFVARAILGVAPLGLVLASGEAHAQIAGATARPLPNVLLLVDTSGSMERMADSSLPSANRGAPTPPNKCAPGSQSNPNRWGMLLQALTGNMQPYYSCDAVDRTQAAFKNEFKINGKPVYDADYFLPYHRPLTGAAPNACTFAAYSLPGAPASAGVGPLSQGSGGDARDLPTDAFTQVLNDHLRTRYAANSGLDVAANSCTFQQTPDGQLDAARDYIRFGLMTFDNDTDPGVGVMTSAPPSGNVNTTNPFLGEWSYVKSGANTLTSSTLSALAMGQPAGCTDPLAPYAFEVGARHAAAPPWEGRMVGFPAPNANLFDIGRVNEDIQKVLLASRPYGATPIEGMLEDARDYLWFNDAGPNGTGANKDAYVSVGCREQFIILLTDGAPNLDMRPSCTGTGGKCPFNTSAKIAESLAKATGNKKVKTFVIGFSVNGAGDVAYTNDGFPTSPLYTSCKAWYQGAGGTPSLMQSACAAQNPPKGSTADACCQLNEIAYWGTDTNKVGPYFAETQADLVLSFGRILGSVTKDATTRTLPGYAPAVTIAGVGNTADYIASFIPNARKVWSGEIDRTRSVCTGAVPTPQTPQSVTEGDSYAANLAAQSVAKKRLFISVMAPATSAVSPAGTAIDSARTIRPYAAAAPTDGIPAFVGTEIAGFDDTLKSTTNWAEALEVDGNTCKRSKAVTPGTQATVDVPALSAAQCTETIWGFATAKYGPIKPGGSAYDFNVRCTGSVGNLASGFCSISGGGCTVASSSCPIAGEVCVPSCAALGAIYRSSPTLVGPPNQFLRDDAYLAYSAARAGRRTTMYVASADGVLHAFKALSNSTFDPGDFELWAFVPPAVLPKLATNYPTGQQILLDGTPVVKDTVWDRKSTDPVDANQYHSTLVAGMGAGGPGYYALNVSDPDCGGIAGSTACQGAKFVPATTKAAAYAANGPHFLWPLTDIEKASAGTDPAKQTRTAKDGAKMVALFGRESGTPAITTLQVNPDNTIVRQIGVAILPGGSDGCPVRNGECARAIDGGAPTSFLEADYDFSDSGLKRRKKVRQWGPTCTSPVPGRGVTIVRLDTGEILRHFGRTTQDVPLRIAGKTTDSPFDSPVIGTPIVYPNLIGATAQKIFVGDADGTVWRIDVSSPDPAKWKVSLFQDLISLDLPSPAPGAAESQPVNIPMVLSLDPTGGLVLNAATGDQENLVVTTEKNYIYSIQEQRPTASGTPGYAKVRWYRALDSAQRVTGPMTVFDRTLYFATYKPAIPAAGTCTDGGTPTLWGMDFFNADPLGADKGGAPRWCPLGKVDSVTGSCQVALTQNEDPTLLFPDLKGAIIPGVTIRAAQSCATFDATPNDPALTGMSSTKFDIFFGATNTRTGGGTGTPQAVRPEVPITRPLPRQTARVDAWALVVD